MVQDLVYMINEVNGHKTTYRLKENLFNAKIYEKQMEDILNGLIF
jgi:hypothetical protein